MPLPPLLLLRPLTDAETEQLAALAQSRTAEARLRDRARICWASHQGRRVMQIVAELGVTEPTVRTWIHRFNTGGLPALADAPRAGRPATLTPAQTQAVRTVGLSHPADLGLPFGSWTLDRLTGYLREERGIPIHRSRVGELLRAAGLHWRREEWWLDGRVDPAFAEKRGPS
jgi:transposase